MSAADQIPAPRPPAEPLLAAQADANQLVQTMISHLGERAAAVNFLALPATVRCEILIHISDLGAILAAAGIMHPHPAVKP